MNYDVLIIGAGPAGYVAAIRGRQLGLSVGLIEEDRPGGVCLNRGCIPTKSLLHQGSLYRELSRAPHLGRVHGSIDYSEVHTRSREAAETLSRGVEALLKRNKVDLHRGSAQIVAPGSVELDGERRLKGKAIVLACGAAPRKIRLIPFDGRRVLSSDDALKLTALPRKAAIVGAGAVGLEFAQVWHDFGVEVEIIEAAPRLLPTGDSEASAHIEKIFRRRGIKTSPRVQVRAAELPETGGVELTLQGAEGIERREFDQILVAVGRNPRVENLGLERVGVEYDRSGVKTGEYYQTCVPGIYAIGDLNGESLLAHAASRQGELVMEHLAGMQCGKRISLDTIPACVYTDPEVASIGFMERELQKLEGEYRSAGFPFRGNGKAVSLEDSEGFVKVFFRPKTHEILGAVVVGPQASTLIHELMLARHSELLLEDIAGLMHAHPTLSEAVGEAALAGLGRAIHM